MVRPPLAFLLALAGAFPAFAESPLLHPAFTFTAESFAPVAQALPEDLRAAVLADPKAFLEDYRPLLGAPSDQLVLVDKKNELPADYEPDDLVALRSPTFAVNRRDLRFRKAYVPALTALTAAAKKEGLKLTLSSSYRSWAYQKDLFQSYVNRDGVATAERYSARPGRSQHQLGTVIDFGSVTPEFAVTKEGQWLAAHAGEYGFSLSYPEGQEPLTGYTYEPWHYRYIGVAACAVQKKWFGDLQQRLTEFQNAEGAVLKAALRK
jgi:D-alanyl-D-alanine carboxypeptidase